MGRADAGVQRIDGKVRQEHVAALGSIDGTLLPGFWAEVTPDVARAVQKADWAERSIRARMQFWQEAKPRLERLANRLGPDLKRLRMAVHARVPWPKEPERADLPLMEANGELASAMSGYETATKMVEDNEALIEHLTKQNRELRELVMMEARAVAAAGKRVQRLKQPDDTA